MKSARPAAPAGLVARLVADAGLRGAWLDDLRELAAFLRVRAAELDAPGPGAAAAAAAAPDELATVTAAGARDMLEQVLRGASAGFHIGLGATSSETRAPFSNPSKHSKLSETQLLVVPGVCSELGAA